MMNFSSEEAKKALSKKAKKDRDLLIKEFMCAAIIGITSARCKEYDVDIANHALIVAEDAADLYLARIKK